jgi:urease accessory protein
MAWHANLQLHYRSNPATNGSARTDLQFSHTGPLRVLQSLYPEGHSICHNVLVHPPGGIVGGDTLDIQVQLGAGTHALITTPGATRFYKSNGAAGVQQVNMKIADTARLEWLPLETICYNGCEAVNRAQFDLAPDAEMIGWDITALGLPHAELPFVQGSLAQHIEVQGAWLERAHIDASDKRLLHSPLGLAGHLCMGTLFFACGSAITRERREALLDALRQTTSGHALAKTSGVTAAHPRVVVLRTLAPVTEPALDLLRRAWATLRHTAWDMPAQVPRIWSM